MDAASKTSEERPGAPPPVGKSLQAKQKKQKKASICIRKISLLDMQLR
jgi:hypothetical protein